jgi:hypothetical protein
MPPTIRDLFAAAELEGCVRSGDRVSEAKLQELFVPFAHTVMPNRAEDAMLRVFLRVFRAC